MFGFFLLGYWWVEGEVVVANFMVFLGVDGCYCWLYVCMAVVASGCWLYAEYAFVIDMNERCDNG